MKKKGLDPFDITTEVTHQAVPEYGVLTILRGIPASGKSTYAKQLVKEDSEVLRVNKDDIRAMFSQQYSHELEMDVRGEEQDIVESLIIKGYDVVVDDTNLQQRDIDRFKDLAELHNYTMKLVTFGTAMELCIARNNLREGRKKVPTSVIERMYKTLTDGKV